ncbi:hypothetical protein CHUAL_011653 [Chamberlinius hualienensis]
MSKLEMASGRIAGTFRLIMDFILTYLLAGYYLPKQLLTPHVIPTGLKSRKNEVAIVTGGNRGIGLQVVQQLLSLDMHVIIACRKPNNELENIKQLNKDYPNATVEAMTLDFCSLVSVRKFAAEFGQRELPLHILVNNSGVMFVPYGETAEGFEHHIGVNYLGHFLLTRLLLPQLKASGTSNHRSRVVNVSSCVAFVGNINYDKFKNKWVKSLYIFSHYNKCQFTDREGYSPYGCYSQSKLAQIMFTWSLQQHLNEEDACVTVNALHPGIIYSDLYQHVWWVNMVPSIAKAIYKTPKQGADGIVYCACSNETETKSPQYYENCHAVDPPSVVLDPNARKRLWEESCRLVDLSN